MRGHELHSVLEFCVFLNETEFFKGVLSKESRSEGGRSRGRHVTLAGEPLSLGGDRVAPGADDDRHGRDGHVALLRIWP